MHSTHLYSCALFLLHLLTCDHDDALHRGAYVDALFHHVYDRVNGCANVHDHGHGHVPLLLNDNVLLQNARSSFKSS
jgi:hypothetical protein